MQRPTVTAVMLGGGMLANEMDKAAEVDEVPRSGLIALDRHAQRHRQHSASIVGGRKRVDRQLAEIEGGHAVIQHGDSPVALPCEAVANPHAGAAQPHVGVRCDSIPVEAGPCDGQHTAVGYTIERARPCPDSL